MHSTCCCTESTLGTRTSLSTTAAALELQADSALDPCDLTGPTACVLLPSGRWAR